MRFILLVANLALIEHSQNHKTPNIEPNQESLDHNLMIFFIEITEKNAHYIQEKQTTNCIEINLLVDFHPCLFDIFNDKEIQ